MYLSPSCNFKYSFIYIYVKLMYLSLVILIVATFYNIKPFIFNGNYLRNLNY
jgi:hypothetical protein